MKKILLLITLIATFASCSKDDKSVYEIVNLSGVNWYNTQIWYSNESNSNAEFTGFDTFGTVLIGESLKITTDNLYILVSAENSSGGLVMSDRIPVSGSKIIIRESDMLSR